MAQQVLAELPFYTFETKPKAVGCLLETSIIIPAYNEELGLPVVLSNVLSKIDGSCEVLVVDDGSTDGTKPVASGFPCTVISHEANYGKGQAIKTGAAVARGENIISIDADDTYPVETISAIVSGLEDYDLVIASRSKGTKNIPLVNRFGNAIIGILIRIVSGYKLSDPLTGLYGIKKSHLTSMSLSSRGFGLETEISIKAAKMGLKMLEIPIDYRSRLGEAKLNALRDGWIIFTTILRFAFWQQPQETA
ncbi:MAG: glycosyltransferase family 2 protein [Dehalococcoidia bacterium]|jgi:glycosyltransferase involved in cell wall biosynthesis